MRFSDKHVGRGAALALAVAGASVLAAQAQAQTTWINPGTGNWSNPDNWDAGEPTAGVRAILNNGGTIIIDQSDEESGLADINGQGTFDIRPGADLLMSDSMRIGLGSDGDGTLLMSGGDVNITGGGGDLTVGDVGGTGFASITGGTITAIDNYLVGGGGNSDGTVSQDGGDLMFGNLVIVGGGPGSTGDYTMTGGSLTQLGENGFWIGNNAAATGSFDHQGGTIDANLMNVGNNGTGSYTHSGGALNVVTDLTVAAGSDANGTFTVRGSDGSITADNFLAGAGTANLIFEIEDSTGTTLIDVIDAADLSGMPVDIDLVGYVPSEGETFDLIAANSITGHTLAAEDQATWNLSVDSVGGREILQATFIPEPGTAMLALMGAGGLLIRRRRA